MWLRESGFVVALALLSGCATRIERATAIASPAQQTAHGEASPQQADERDARVLEAVVSALLRDPIFDGALHPKGRKRKMILLTPSIRGVDSRTQIEADTEDRVPEAEYRNLLDRNKTTETFHGLRFSRAVVVMDDTGMSRHWPNDWSFRKNYPWAKGWIRPHLPGYSADGSTAFVRATIGPSSHGGRVSAYLKKVGNRWTIVWHKISWYL